MVDTRQYPGGKDLVSSWSNRILTFYNYLGTKLAAIDPVNSQMYGYGIVNFIRTRFTIAQINAGATLLAAKPGWKYKAVQMRAISVGGAAGTVTTVDILATQTSSVKLAAFAQANLTQSAVLTAGGTGAAVLADGASFVANDVNTAITVGKTGGSVDTATHIDVLFSYVVEPG